MVSIQQENSRLKINSTFKQEYDPVLVMTSQQSLLYCSRVNLGKCRPGTTWTGSFFFHWYIRSSFAQPSEKQFEHVLSFMRTPGSHCTLVGLSTRPAPLIISKSLQFRTFCSQSNALFVIRCILSVGSGSKMFGALKVTISCQIF